MRVAKRRAATREFKSPHSGPESPEIVRFQGFLITILAYSLWSKISTICSNPGMESMVPDSLTRATAFWVAERTGA